MIIDDQRNHVLTKYRKYDKSESDHNVMYAKFGIEYYREPIKTKREIFNFKNKECQKYFFEVTDSSEKLSSCFQSTNSFEGQAASFFKNLNRTFYQSFKKIRITNKSVKKIEPEDEVQKLLELKVKLNIFSRNAKSHFAKECVEKQFLQLEKDISKIQSVKNAKNNQRTNRKFCDT